MARHHALLARQTVGRLRHPRAFINANVRLDIERHCTACLWRLSTVSEKIVMVRVCYCILLPLQCSSCAQLQRMSRNCNFNFVTKVAGFSLIQYISSSKAILSSESIIYLNSQRLFHVQALLKKLSFERVSFLHVLYFCLAVT